MDDQNQWWKRAAMFLGWPEWQLRSTKEASEFKELMKERRKQYKEETGLHEHAWPEKFKYEEIRIKRYRMGRGNFLDHVDVGSLDSAMRFLVLFVSQYGC